MKIISFFKKSGKLNDAKINFLQPFIWCLVGNIKENIRDNEKGSKHFSSGTRVYCFPEKWGDGYKKIKVLGKHRKCNKNITIIIPANHITNWRLKKVYKPWVIKRMVAQEGWSNRDIDKSKIKQMLSWIS